ncbi:UDP-glucose 4-epimerase GalE [Sinimarinibacterium sp. NLF-5-8]|uniref:UDP-glucose 4-epimerase GalE n=1 Tax=Sinimarinibacterium sp. NLF-5-8 TaxID=2698684 RepID=UPI00137BBEE4|nr:UDP-glucose 4-epimerase GalE [Sinimarinibacterium sp. NLF-5-8]QHS09395.1 UDP-glucose 4-epimerase GalE [Sinimarinibacterium sp. NLF-5-8]
MSILVTGGAGYIGSHTVLELLQAGHDVIVLDNLCNSAQESLARVAQITGHSAHFIQGDVRDAALLAQIFAQNRIESVIHFAGLKAVGESVAQPLRYYQNNVEGTLTLCDAMQKAGVFTLVFSSTATVYGNAQTMPISEATPTGHTTNPYGSSKLMVENILRDLAAADPRWRIAVLRYFNPVGAHSSGKIGEDPQGIPNNLLPYIAQVAVGRLPKLNIFGNDYPTPDGTGVRDYIHVVDLAQGHLKALDALNQHSGWNVWNLGTGQGYSVLEMVRAFEKASGKAVPCQIAPRRSGDVAQCWSDPSKAQQQLGWQATRDLDQMMQDAWAWQSQNPQGYREA